MDGRAEPVLSAVRRHRSSSLKGKAKAIKESLVEETDETCDKCGRPMVIKWGRNGRFLPAVVNPECKSTKPLNGQQRWSKAGKSANSAAEKCLSRTGRFGKFLGV